MEKSVNANVHDKKTRTSHIDIAKGIGIILVVYGHAAAVWKDTPFYVENFRATNMVIFSVVMPFFFMVSGAFHRGRLEAKDFAHKKLLIKITQTLLLPFYSLSAVFLILNLSLQKYVPSYSWEEMIFSMLFQQSSDSLPSGVLWFLYTLFSLSLSTYILVKLCRVPPFLLLLFAIFLRSELNPLRESMYFGFNHYSINYVYFVFGYAFRDFFLAMQFYSFRNFVIIFIGYACLLTMAIYKVEPEFIKPVMDIISLFGVSGILGALLILLLSKFMESKKCFRIITTILAYYGTFSILVYVFHMPTFTVMKKIKSFISIEHIYMQMLLLFIPGIVLPLIYGKVLSMNTTVYRFLLGRNP